ncbi:MAG: YceI family protein [Pseudomonadota bacterium]|nr:YceI family protein [Pseudomonadota bacterium]
MMKFSAVVLFLACLAFPVHATEWILDKSQSRLGFTATQDGAPFTGGFRNFDARITFDPDQPGKASARVTIDTKSFYTGTPDRDSVAATKEWFDVTQFPEATFQSTSFSPTGDNGYMVEGKLTIRNISLPVKIPATITVDGDKAIAIGKLSLNRADFGIGQGQWATGNPVSLTVEVNFTINAVRAKGQ